ncbi:hypothetical protein [Rhizobium leguminosarum]|uniref:hypothetical protein n=2 Tax=Rhizobium leguminosarum TaxID=384 RepID=UPI001AECC7B8|nr:hypothetical protein [Rhizobium leguminosarum]
MPGYFRFGFASAGGCPVENILDDRVADRLMGFASMVVQQLVKNAGCQGYEVETERDCCGTQLRQCFERPEIRTQPEFKIVATDVRKSLEEERLKRAVVADDGICDRSRGMRSW